MLLISERGLRRFDAASGGAALGARVKAVGHVEWLTDNGAPKQQVRVFCLGIGVGAGDDVSALPAERRDCK